METIARVIRSSRTSSTSQSRTLAPLVVLQDEGYDTVGGDVIFRRLVDRLGTLHPGDTLGSAVVVCIDNPPDLYIQGGVRDSKRADSGVGSSRGNAMMSHGIHVIDCFSNPCGFPGPNSGPCHEKIKQQDGIHQHAWLCLEQQDGGQMAASLEKLERCIYNHVDHIVQKDHISMSGIDTNDSTTTTTTTTTKSSGDAAHTGSNVVVAIDGVSPLMQQFGSRRVAHFITRIRGRPNVRCVIGYLHRDMHDSNHHEMALVSHDAMCILHLAPGWGLAVDQSRPGDPIGNMVVNIKRSQGCKKTEMYEYWIGDGEEGGLRIRMSKGRELNSTPSTSDSKAAIPTLLTQMGSKMRLELSEEERKAKTNVILPYEHQGYHDAYHTNDYRDYLPPEAGGRGPSSGPLGHILYVRESDSEGDFDSDEDPDDDLDI